VWVMRQAVHVDGGAGDHVLLHRRLQLAEEVAGEGEGRQGGVWGQGALPALQRVGKSLFQTACSPLKTKQKGDPAHATAAADASAYFVSITLQGLTDVQQRQVGNEPWID
jgi:hypothetical protein